MSNVINWFEIPVKNFEQARKFYETIFDIQLIVTEEPMKMGMFTTDCEQGEVGGAIVTGEESHQPSNTGTTVYFNEGRKKWTIQSDGLRFMSMISNALKPFMNPFSVSGFRDMRVHQVWKCGLFQ